VALKNEREIAVYLPPQYSPHAEPYPLLVLFDEHAYLGEAGESSLVPTPTILDNLISEARIPPWSLSWVGNAPGARDRELPCNRQFTAALVDELLPWVHRLYNFTSDPRQTVVAGSSFGGLAAACAGLGFPDVWKRPFAIRLLPFEAALVSDATIPVRNELGRASVHLQPQAGPALYLEAGSAEFDATARENSILSSTRTLRDVLRAKGYEVHFQELPVDTTTCVGAARSPTV